MKLLIDSLKSKAKKLLKQRLVFPFETELLFKNKIETLDRLARIPSQKVLQTTVRFPFEKEIETMDRLAIIQGQKNLESTVRFTIRKQN